jgi:hypothetical protein
MRIVGAVSSEIDTPDVELRCVKVALLAASKSVRGKRSQP